ncbi:MAG: hypothetical protein J7M25_00790 [Deltaproteobacteria bacterium]|nr:hypothetical protein [Deltaproteobacteria bacterium]
MTRHTRHARSFIVSSVAAVCAMWGASQVAGCVHIGSDPIPEQMDFDPTATPPRLPQPVASLVNPDTGLLDLSLAGIEVPDDCENQDVMPEAQCEFYQFMEQLDGFPTVMAATAPVSASLDMSTLTMPSNLFILNSTRAGIVDATDVNLTFDATDNLLNIEPKNGWDLGSTYVIAVRGYDDGVKTTDGTRIVTASTFYLLKQEESLTCDTQSADEIPSDCKYLKLLGQQMDEQSARVNLVQLEGIRQQLSPAFDAVSLLGEMPRDEVAMLWAVPIQSATVAELQPTLGMLPQVSSSQDIMVPVKGPVNPATVSRSTMANPDGTVVLLNLTKLANGDNVGGVPTFDATYLDGQGVGIHTEGPMIDGDLYCVIFSKSMRDPDFNSLVPSPVTVMLRARGELIDADGHSNVAEFSDADAAQLEVGRLQMKTLLDDPQFQALTRLKREDIVYLYAFTYPDPTTSD